MADTPKHPISRKRFLGLDIVTLNTPEAIATALNSGDLARFTDVISSIDELPWLFRWFFRLSLFYNVALHGWFMAFRATDDPTYPPCRAFLDQKFAVPQDISAIVSETADALQNPMKLPSDRVLSDLCIRAIWPHFAPQGHPDIPKHILDSVDKQLGSVLDSVLPWRFFAAKPNIADVYEFMDETLKRNGEREAVPDPIVTDAAHVMFAMNLNGPPLLRELAQSVDDDVDAIFTRLGLVKNTIRIAKRDGTLGGLLDDNKPVEARKTIVKINIRSAGIAAQDIAYAFSSGPGTRRCVAEQAVLAYVKAVQEELKHRRSASS